MKTEEKLNELMDYIAALNDYYKTVLSEEKTDSNRSYIKGKLNVLGDIGKRLKKLEIH